MRRLRLRPAVDRRTETAEGLDMGAFPLRTWLGAALTFSAAIVASVHRGAFFFTDARTTALLCTLAVVLQVVLRQVDRRAIPVLVAVGALAVWWYVRADATQRVDAFLPLGASMIAFGAAFIAVRPLAPRLRSVAVTLVALFGAFEALLGFRGLIFRRWPYAIPDQSLWRLAGTLTYSNAAGLLLALITLLTLGLSSGSRLARLSLCLCFGGVIGAQSRGAAAAFVVGACLVPLEQYRRFWFSLCMGAVVGTVAVATSTSLVPVPALAVVLVACTVTAFAVNARPLQMPRRRTVHAWQVISGCAVIAAMCVGTAFAVRSEISLRLLSPAAVFDRDPEWQAAFHQFTQHVFVGAGPDQILPFVGNPDQFAHFAHNEYLQIAAGGGVVALLLLTGLAVVLACCLRRTDVPSSCAMAALVAFAVGGAFDFTWHLPAIAIVAGWAAGFAGSPGDRAESAGSPDLVGPQAPQAPSPPQL